MVTHRAPLEANIKIMGEEKGNWQGMMCEFDKVPDNPDNLCPADIIQWHLIICRQVMQGEQSRLMGRQCSSSCSAEVEWSDTV